MEAIVAAIITGGVSLVGIGVGLRRNKTRVKALDHKIDNGLKSVIAEIHREMTLVVLPELQQAKEFREGYKGTIWSDKEAIDAWVSNLDDRFDRLQRRLDDHIHEQVGQIDSLRSGINQCSTQISDHDDWERREKYDG